MNRLELPVTSYQLPDRQGAALVAVIVTALIASVAAFGALLLAMSHAQTSDVQVDRLRAHYAAEAGLVLAQQKLWNEAVTPFPPGCPAGGTGTVQLPTQINALTVDVTVTNCGAGNAHRIQAKVTY